MKKQKVSLSPFWEAVTLSGALSCIFAHVELEERHRDCQGRIQAMHINPKQRVYREYGRLPLTELGGILCDPRNGKPGCWRHHQLLDNGRIYLTADMLPRGYADFCAEHPELGRAPTVKAGEHP